MKILFAADVQPDPNSGASGTEVQTLAAMRRLGHEIDEIWAPDLPRRVGHGNLHYLLELPRAYRNAIAARWVTRDFDVVHVNQGHSFLAALDHRRRGRRGVFVFRSHGLELRGAEVIRHWRTELDLPKRSFLKALPGRFIDARLLEHERRAVRAASGVIVSSSLDREFLVDVEGVPSDRVACIAQSAPDDYLAIPPHPLTDERLRRILYVGGFGFVKAPHTVAAAANLLLTEGSELRMTWVCQSADHGAVAELLTPPARARVTLEPWRDQADLRSAYDAHGIFLFPSFFEGFGKAFLEAMARGLCVIATRTGGMRDLIRDGENGWLCGFHAADEIVACVARLHAEPQRARAMAASAACTAREHTWDRVGAATIAFYERLMRSSAEHHDA